MASSSSLSIQDFNSLEREVAEVLLQLRTLTPSFSSPFLITTWLFKGRRSAIDVEPSPSPPSSPLHHSSPPPPPPPPKLLLPPPPPVLPAPAICSNKVEQQPESPNSTLSFPSSDINYQSNNSLEPKKKKIKFTKEETSLLLSVPPPPPTMQITLNPKPPLTFFLPGDSIDNIIQKKPQSSSFSTGVTTPSSLISKEAADKFSKSSNNVNKKSLISLSPGKQVVHLKKVSNNNPVVPTEVALGPTTPSPQQKSYLQPLINNNNSTINHQTAVVDPPVSNTTTSYPKCLKAISIINMNTKTPDKTIRMSYNPTIATTTPAVSEQIRKRKFEVQ